MIKITHINGDEKVVTKGAFESIFKPLGYKTIVNKEIKKEEVKDINISGLEDMLWVNCLSHLVCIEALIPQMIEKGEGLIINVLSSCCKANITTMGGYTASKKAMEALSKILVKEVKDKGIKVLDVYPGGVDTNFRTNERTDYLRPETIAKHIIYVLENNEDGMMQEIVCRPIVENNY